MVLGERILKHADNLSKTLQHKNIYTTKPQSITSLTVKTLQLIRNDNSYDLFWELLLHQASQCDVAEPVLPRQRKMPKCYKQRIAKAEFLHLPRGITKEFTLRHLIWLLIGLINLGTVSMKTWSYISSKWKRFQRKIKGYNRLYLNGFDD